MLPILTAFPLPEKASGAHSPPAFEQRAGQSTGAGPVVAIQPLGDLDPALIEVVAGRIERTFAVHVIVLSTKSLPQFAFYRPRMRFRGERLIDWLETTRPAGTTKILGLMSRDLSVTKGPTYDWGVMGVAGFLRPSGVVSIYRLTGHHPSEDLVMKRACRVAVHELGHTFGLQHCDTPHCIMNDAHGGIASVDESSGEFCKSCRAKLGNLLRN